MVVIGSFSPFSLGFWHVCPPGYAAKEKSNRVSVFLPPFGLFDSAVYSFRFVQDSAQCGGKFLRHILIRTVMAFTCFFDDRVQRAIEVATCERYDGMTPRCNMLNVCGQCNVSKKMA